jgi:PAS domain S-box-containing protein
MDNHEKCHRLSNSIRDALVSYFDRGLIGMAVTGLDKRWLEVNDRLCEILGRSREELLRSNWAELTHPDDLQPNLRLFDQLRSGEIEQFTMDKRFLRKDRSIVYTTIHVRAFRTDDGSMDHLVTLTEDITARKLAEERLHASEERYRTLVEMSPDAVIMCDREGRVTFASPRTLQMYGTETAADLLGRNPLKFLASEDHHKFLANLRKTLDEGVTRGIEYRFLRKDGTCFLGEASAAAIRDAAGRPTGFVAVIRDVTERHKAQEALLQERRGLEHMLRASDHERQLIAYDIHDGLAQDLAGAIMQFQACEHQQGCNLQAAQQAFMGGLALLRQGHNETRRLISGLRPPILDEAGVMAAILHLVADRGLEQQPKVVLQSKVRFCRLVPILENTIYRIVQEGLTNACKHSRSEEVHVSLIQRNRQLRIEIRDWGTGFDPKVAHKNRYGLTGMRERARLLGGELHIHSKPGQGTSVIVQLPLAFPTSSD